MTQVERQRFIEEEVKGLYPQWEPTDAELRAWMSRLAPLDYGRARAAIQACFSEQATNFRRPVLGRFLEHARSLSRGEKGRESRSSDPTTNVFMECLIPPAGKPHLTGVRKAIHIHPASRRSDPDYVDTCAEQVRAQFDHLYGGRWITVQVRDTAKEDALQESAR
ncbi:MAG: hypothetical protein KBE65_18995 [Phycisphaerae bacterium]|nr:hypothetical protein [Phycisphaerae bacterium]